jgi:hypothetical protein
MKKSKFTEQQIALPCADWVPMRSGDKGGGQGFTIKPPYLSGS